MKRIKMYNVGGIYGQGGCHSMKQNFITVIACVKSCLTCFLHEGNFSTFKKII